jgi:uncharacterized phage protein gp47/JayE
MALNWLGKTKAVRQFIAAVQAAAQAAVDSSEGSFTLAMGQAATGAFLWLQAQLVHVLKLTRAATSALSDLDGWMADWFFVRFGATAATGQATFSRSTPTLQAVAPVGQLISNGPGGLQFIVTTDAGNPAYSALLGGYVLAPATLSVTVPIAAVSPGAAGNVLANTITSFVSPISGVDSVTNAAALTNGAEAEADDAFRARFKLYISSLRLGTVAAIKAAVLATRQGIQVVVIENKAADLTTDNGMVTLVIDDGTGNPSDDIVNAAGLAVDATRAAGIRFGVIKPVVTVVTITLTVVSQDSGKHAADTAAARAAIMAYINSLPVGVSLIWARLYQLAFDATANIIGVNTILVNGATADITVTAKGVVKTTSVTVS